MTQKRRDFLMGYDPKVVGWLKKLGVLQGGPVSRVVIDIPMDGVVTFYIERPGDDRLVSVGLPEAMLRAEIVERVKAGVPKMTSPFTASSEGSKP
jgi:hypothetical protein